MESDVVRAQLVKRHGGTNSWIEEDGVRPFSSDV